MNRMLLFVVLASSGICLMGCDLKDDVPPPKTTRSMSIAGMPVYEKDFRLPPILAQQVEMTHHHP